RPCHWWAKCQVMQLVDTGPRWKRLGRGELGWLAAAVSAFPPPHHSATIPVTGRSGRINCGLEIVIERESLANRDVPVGPRLRRRPVRIAGGRRRLEVSLIGPVEIPGTELGRAAQPTTSRAATARPAAARATGAAAASRVSAKQCEIGTEAKINRTAPGAG